VEDPVTTETVWQYEWVAGDGSRLWIEEDDEMSASWKAFRSTGRIRSRQVTTRRTAWAVKNQDMVEATNE
jgi:hypothetical protein